MTRKGKDFSADRSSHSEQDDQIEVYIDRGAWWVQIITPGLWKRLFGPFPTEEMAQEKVLEEVNKKAF